MAFVYHIRYAASTGKMAALWKQECGRDLISKTVSEYMELSPFLQDLSRMPIMQRLMVVAIYAVLAKAVDIFVNRILKRLAAAYTTSELDDKAIDILHFPIVFSVFFFGVLHAVTMEPGLAQPWEKFVPAVAQSIALIVWTLAALRLFVVVGEHYLESISDRGKIGADLFLLLKNVIRVIVVVSALIWLLSIWNINLAPLFASAGIAGIALTRRPPAFAQAAKLKKIGVKKLFTPVASLSEIVDYCTKEGAKIIAKKEK